MCSILAVLFYEYFEIFCDGGGDGCIDRGIVRAAVALYSSWGRFAGKHSVM